jgi:antitoxin (DNA-binding transcriptional repressor) of toxin-antitoxin stability system
MVEESRHRSDGLRAGAVAGEPSTSGDCKHGRIIAKAGTPLAKLGPLDLADRKKRRLGILAGRLKVPADFDAPLPSDVLDAFKGRRCGRCSIRMYCSEP